jgi:hypothetical protein
MTRFFYTAPKSNAGIRPDAYREGERQAFRELTEPSVVCGLFVGGRLQPPSAACAYDNSGSTEVAASSSAQRDEAHRSLPDDVVPVE